MNSPLRIASAAPLRLWAFACLVVVATWAPGCGGGGGGSSTPIVVPATQTITYVGMGASDAVGIGALPSSMGYVFLIRDRLQDAGNDTTFLNTGINGAEIDGLQDPQLAQALAANPDIVTIWTGSNDLIGGADPDEFASKLNALLTSLTANTSAKIYIGDLVDLTDVPRFRVLPDADVTAARVDAFNQRIVTAAATHGCTVVPLSSENFTDNMFFIDGFHPNNLGYATMADAFWDAIEPDLAP